MDLMENKKKQSQKQTLAINKFFGFVLSSVQLLEQITSDRKCSVSQWWTSFRCKRLDISFLFSSRCPLKQRRSFTHTHFYYCSACAYESHRTGEPCITRLQSIHPPPNSPASLLCRSMMGVQAIVSPTYSARLERFVGEDGDGCISGRFDCCAALVFYPQSPFEVTVSTASKQPPGDGV